MHACAASRPCCWRRRPATVCMSDGAGQTMISSAVAPTTALESASVFDALPLTYHVGSAGTVIPSLPLHISADSVCTFGAPFARFGLNDSSVEVGALSSWINNSSKEQELWVIFTKRPVSVSLPCIVCTISARIDANYIFEDIHVDRSKTCVHLCIVCSVVQWDIAGHNARAAAGEWLAGMQAYLNLYHRHCFRFRVRCLGWLQLVNLSL